MKFQWKSATPNCLNPMPENLFHHAGNNQECNHKPHLHIIEVAGAVAVGVAIGMLAVLVREGTTMMAVKAADTAHISGLDIDSSTSFSQMYLGFYKAYLLH